MLPLVRLSKPSTSNLQTKSWIKMFSSMNIRQAEEKPTGKPKKDGPTWDDILVTLRDQTSQPKGETKIYTPQESSTPVHVVNIKCSKNNTILSLADDRGNVLVKSSAGLAGYTKANRRTPEAAYAATQLLIQNALKKQIPVGTNASSGDGEFSRSQAGHVWIRFNGFGAGRDQAFRALRAASWNIVQLEDVTPIKHGGSRPRKKRRV